MTEAVLPRVVHALPGRLRVKLDSDDPSEPGRWEARFRALPGVTDVQVNRITRSLLVLYEPAAGDPAPSLGLSLAPREPARTERPAVSGPEAPLSKVPPTPAAHSVARGFWRADRALSEWSNGRVDLKLAVPAVLLGAGLWELFTGVEVAAATFHTLTWYAYNLFIHLHPELTVGVSEAPPEDPGSPALPTSSL